MPMWAGFRSSTFWALLALCCSAASAGPGIDLGTAGKLYPIAEQDLLQQIRDRLLNLRDSGELQRLQRRSRQQVLDSVRHLPGIALPRALRPRIRYLDVSLRLSHDLYDDDGRILFLAGLTINPLRQRPLSRQLVFLDGTDPIQQRWVKEHFSGHPRRSKLILSAGDPMALGASWKQPVYFDQHQYLVNRFGIEFLPSIVRQQGSRLRIEEIVLDEQ